MIKIPDYRFKNYAESWEEKKLGELVERVTRKNKNLESDLPLTISAQYGLIDQQTFFNKKVASKDVSGYYLLKKGEFAYNKSYSSDYPWGAVKRLDNYEMGVLSTLYIVFRPNSIDSDFLAVYYDSPKWYKEVSMRAAEGARNHGLLNISPQDFFDTELIFPVNQSEQTAIGSFFQDIDQLINLQQRKLEVLKEQKKTYLKFLFPAKGQTKPALRFAGFEDDWKRKNFGDFLVEFNEKTIVENQHELLSSTNNGIEPRKGRVSGESNIGYKVLKKDMIVLSPQNLWLGNINYNADYESGIVSPSYKIFNVLDIDKKFISILIRHPYMNYEYGQASVQGASVVRRNLDIDLFNTIQILLPSLEEQTLIGSFFQDLDKTIAKQEEKVNQLKESKQTLLRKMFI